ncbi:hypothetical protein [Cerasicoccus arenae]|uniref:Uncharacterized protein n=1 Tax=Cerasicoccus arenae TaxID=424488 RepID=A0A8J3DD89_9BACT|nr:hypothetical protein [Cerasicoccus arenae]MBK1857110.1 hypothetical protein [Cerasicoccus arenae]GHB92420.1 hypothetical protein GCM10007047_04420 [Cerasicoccus arenae]
MNQIIPIILWSLKVAVPTIIFILGAQLLIISHSKWESLIGRIVGINDLEISKTGFIVLKLVATIFVISSLAIAYVLFIKK